MSNPLDEFDNPIDKLAYLSGCYRAKHIDPRPHGIEGYIINDATLEEFAQSIIRECANIINETRWMVPPTQEQIAKNLIERWELKE